MYYICNMKCRILTLAILICGLVLSAFTGCDRDDSVVEYTIPVVNRCNEPFSFDDYFRKLKRVNVDFDDEYPVSAMISDIVFTKRYAFILDVNRVLSKVDLRKRKVVCQRPMKRSQVVLSYYDKHLYILGLGSNCIVYEYDLNLNQTDSISIRNMDASSFCRMKNGYIFLNSRETSTRGRYVITNKTLTRGVSFVKVGERPKPYNRFEATMILSSEVFIPGSFGKVLCFDFEHNDGYRYDGEKMKRVFHVGTDVTDPDAVPLRNTQVIYASDGKILFNYYNADATDGIAYFDKHHNLVVQGPSYDTATEGLFKYRYRQVGRKLVRIHMVMPEDRGDYPYKAIQAQFDFYRLK